MRALSASLATEAARRVALRRFARSPFGEIERFGLKFKNPVGLAAGFDKNGKVARQLAALGSLVRSDGDAPAAGRKPATGCFRCG